jgi:LAS superfamily LD-carboxypeptidase LdcB
MDESHLVDLPCGHRMREPAAQAFALLQADAREAGFDLVIASSFRSYERQLAIWNAKASGERPVYDEQDEPVGMSSLTPAQQLRAILRYSAIPGSSRHHWGTDIDVYDAAAVPAAYQVQLSAREVSSGGVFDALHCWLDQRMQANQSQGFFRPYAHDTGGVAPERWHLSFAPLALPCSGLLRGDLLRECWDAADELLLRAEIEGDMAEIMRRYVQVPQDWCPAQ